jgi:hypothetical protein
VGQRGRIALAAVAAVAAACGDDTGWPGNNGDDPPALVLRADGAAIEIGPHSYSTRNMAADGTTLPADGPAVVVDTDDVLIEAPSGGWTFVARGESADGASSSLRLEPADELVRLVPPPAGTCDVWVTARYRADGSTSEASTGYVFRWDLSTN